jgi:hypothetical protein
MIRAEALLVDGQGAPIKRSGFLQSIGGLEHIRPQSLELKRFAVFFRDEITCILSAMQFKSI